MRGEQLKAGNDKSHRPQNIPFVVFIHRKYLRTLLYFKRAFFTTIIWQKLFKKKWIIYCPTIIFKKYAEAFFFFLLLD